MWKIISSNFLQVCLRIRTFSLTSSHFPALMRINIILPTMMMVKLIIILNFFLQNCDYSDVCSDQWKQKLLVNDLPSNFGYFNHFSRWWCDDAIFIVVYCLQFETWYRTLNKLLADDSLSGQAVLTFQFIHLTFVFIVLTIFIDTSWSHNHCNHTFSSATLSSALLLVSLSF